MDAASAAVLDSMVTTFFALDGYTVERNLGIVRGIIVRSRSIFETLGASLQTMVGGEITLFTNRCEAQRVRRAPPSGPQTNSRRTPFCANSKKETRAPAFQRMAEHAAQLGVNAVIGVRYDVTAPRWL